MLKFGTSGIRAKWPEINEKVALSLALKLGNLSNEFFIARDHRPTSLPIASSLASGFLSSGASVLDLGICNTPTACFFANNFEMIGVVVTASHNPPWYNGLKVIDRSGRVLTKEEGNEIWKFEEKRARYDEIGTLESYDPIEDHIEALLTFASPEGKLRVLADAANGPMALALEKLSQISGLEITVMNSRMDALSPSRPLEPKKENLEEIARAVKGFDLGFAFDGDGDRIVVVDERGEVLTPEQNSWVFTKAFINEIKSVVTNVEMGMSYIEKIKEVGLDYAIVKVGDPYMGLEIEKRGFDFGTEPCGTFTFRPFHLGPDSLLAMLKLLEFLEESGEKVCEIKGEIKETYVIRRNVSCENEKKKAVMERIKDLLKYEFVEIDGLKVLGEGWSALIRPSGTEELIRVMVEHESKEKAEEKMDELLKLVKEAKG